MLFWDFILNVFRFQLREYHNEDYEKDLDREGCPDVKVYSYDIMFKFRFFK